MISSWLWPEVTHRNGPLDPEDSTEIMQIKSLKILGSLLKHSWRYQKHQEWGDPKELPRIWKLSLNRSRMCHPVVTVVGFVGVPIPDSRAGHKVSGPKGVLIFFFCTCLKAQSCHSMGKRVYSTGKALGSGTNPTAQVQTVERHEWYLKAKMETLSWVWWHISIITTVGGRAGGWRDKGVLGYPARPVSSSPQKVLVCLFFSRHGLSM